MGRDPFGVACSRPPVAGVARLGLSPLLWVGAAMNAKPIPLAVRRAVKERAQNQCEACGGPGPVHLHHRKLRSQGGLHEAVNLLHVHLSCHASIHANPSRSYLLGHLVRSYDDPALVPVAPCVRSGGVA